MLRLLCLIDTDDRTFYFQSALRRLQTEFPDEICGECFSPMAVRMDKTKHAALMKAADACDFAVVYFHGGCGNLPDFTAFWKRVTSHARCFFQSSLPEEIGELMPASRLAPSEYQALNDYFSRATE